MIAYFFLAPIFLLVRPGTPIGHPYVRWHARRASLIMLGGLVVILSYVFLIQGLVTFQVFGISLDSLILTVIMSVLIWYLIHGAYRAYHGVSATEMGEIHIELDTTHEAGGYSEEQKVRILASFIPFIGMSIASRNSGNEYQTGARIGSFFAFVCITLLAFFGGAVSALLFVVTLSGIILFIITGMYLFFRGEFFSVSLYQYIPSYASIEAHIAALCISTYDFLRVAFGGEKKETYRDIYTRKLWEYTQTLTPTWAYIMPAWIMAIPVVNLVTLPSLWLTNMREYKALVIEWLSLTLALGLIVWLYGFQSALGLYLLFPIMSLIVNNGKNIIYRAPGTWVVLSLMKLFSQSKEKVAEIQETKETVSFKYEEKKEEIDKI